MKKQKAFCGGRLSLWLISFSGRISVIALALFVGFLFIFFIYFWLLDPPAELVSIDLEYPEPIVTGTPVVCEAVVRVPWFRRPLGAMDIDIKGDEFGIIHGQEPEIVSYGLGTRDWRLRTALQMYQPGEVTEGRIRVDLTGLRRGEGESLIIPIPAFTVRSLLNSDHDDFYLTMAPPWGEAQEPSVFSWHLPVLVVIGLLVLAMTLSVFLSKFNPERVNESFTSAGEQALSDLFFLNGNKFDNPRYVSLRLTDILKRYLEFRFDLSAFSKTSEEIIEEFAGIVESHQLNQIQYEMLRDVLVTAETVRFSDGELDKVTGRRIINKARQFVAATMTLSLNNSQV